MLQPLSKPKTHTMKNTTKILFIAASAILAITGGVVAGPGHDHNKKVEAGPNGGRLIKDVDPHAEFLVTSDRKVKITFVGPDGKVVAPAEQIVTVTTGDRSAPVKLIFTRSGDGLISDGVVPEGNGLPVIVQIKANPDSKAEITKFNLNLSNCPGCQKAEYACTCSH